MPATWLVIAQVIQKNNGIRKKMKNLDDKIFTGFSSIDPSISGGDKKRKKKMVQFA
jgi:hypothetical protein